MSLKCRLVDEPSTVPGDMWYCPWYVERDIPEFLSRHYREMHAGKRPPLAVVCPDGSLWVVDQVSSNGESWVVSGEAPNITCTPSIAVRNYHGFLVAGEFSDDIEGRKY